MSEMRINLVISNPPGSPFPATWVAQELFDHKFRPSFVAPWCLSCGVSGGSHSVKAVGSGPTPWRAIFDLLEKHINVEAGTALFA